MRMLHRSLSVSLGGVLALLLAIGLGPGCSAGGPDAFQPIAYGARPWSPPPGWDPEPPCSTGYYVAIDSCAGCGGISYALCTGVSFTQCTCGGPFRPGATCPQTFVCSTDDFPPQNWMEFTDYAGPGWAGLDLHGGTADAGGQ
jgi:hypothetical protein